MNWISFQQRLWEAFHTARAFYVRVRDQVRAIYRAPFHLDSMVALASTPTQFEQRRRIDLLRIIILSFLCFEMLLISIVAFLPNVPTFFRWAEVGEFLLGITCLALSSRRYAAMASIVYEFGSFVMILFVAWSDPGGMNQRSLLVYSLVSLIILGSGLLLPSQTIKWATVLIMVIALGSVLIEPIKTPVPSFIRYPHLIAAFTLFFLYSITALLTQVFTSNVRVGMDALFHAVERERELEAMTEEFIHIASHELRAPLTPIILTSGLIKQRSNQSARHSEIAALANELIRHSRRMSNMVEVLMDSTRVQTRKFYIAPALCDVALTIQDVVATQQIQRQQRIVLSGAEQPIQGMIDQQRLWQLATNLVNNALKYSPATAMVEVDVAVSSHADDDQDWLYLRITDHGPGIPPEHVAHIFDRFYRGVYADSAARSDGLGLGLYICHAIVEAHGGTITIDSTLGEGSTFCVALPLHTSNHATVVIAHGQ